MISEQDLATKLKLLSDQSYENLVKDLSEEQITQYNSMVANLTAPDPVLILDWNYLWVENHINEQQQVIDFLDEHGGKDLKNSRFMFHFNTYIELMKCRAAMKVQLPFAFHYSTDAFQHFQGMDAVLPIEMAEAFILMKIEATYTDCAKDPQFFCL